MSVEECMLFSSPDSFSVTGQNTSSQWSLAEAASQACFQGLLGFMEQVKEDEGGTQSYKWIANCSNWLPSVRCYDFAATNIDVMLFQIDI